MKSNSTILTQLGIGISATIGGYLLFTIFSAMVPMNTSPGDGITIGKAKLHNLKRAYEHWLVDYASQAPTTLSIGLFWNKGLSSEYSEAKGIARIDLNSGWIQVHVDGLKDPDISDVWLVDRKTRDKNNGEQSDKHLLAGQLQFNENGAWLNRQINTVDLQNFDINRVIVTRHDRDPALAGVLFGSTSLFQRIYHYPENTAYPWKKSQQANSQTGTAIADGIIPENYLDAELINAGRDIFFSETFDGNGRTCGTCHPEENNFTIDPKFIASLPDDDPLFIAERPQPNPLSNNFEKPELMRKVGLILENTNGFDDLENNFTMRSVPHLLALRTSISPPSAAANDGTISYDDPRLPPDERTGWSGDGSPSDLTVSPQLRGTLRDFSVGAVVQHFTKTLNRTAGKDFRLPTEYELDALEAFMLSLGRQEEFDDLQKIKLTDQRADRGRLNFLGEGLADANGLTCNACHFNGGANTDPAFDFPPEVTPPAFEQTNRSFAPRIEELLDQPRDIVAGSEMPFDDGFGDGTHLFNVPTVIEAADTGPFFHANQVATVEGLIAFYTSQRHLRNGEVLPPIVGLNGSQVANVGAFIRVLNADENARSAIELIDKAQRLRHSEDRETNLTLAKAEITDALEVLEGGAIHYDDAIPLFKAALTEIDSQHYDSSKKTLKAARDSMIVRRNTG